MGRQLKSVTPKAGEPRKPTNLSEQAAAEWDRLMCEIRDSGIQVTPAHRAAVEMAACILADIKSDWKELQTEGTYHAREGGGTIAHPALKRMDSLRRDLAKYLALIGLRPAQAAGAPADETLEDILSRE